MLETKFITAPERRYDLDWLKVFTMFCVFLFHLTMYFNPWGWHSKNAQTSYTISYLSTFLGLFIMPIFFAISGISISQALRSRNAWEFTKERITRLVVPLLFGIVILSPFQVYFERVEQAQFSDSFIAFLPHLFDGWYGLGGNFPWMGLHLWYCLILFIFSMLCLPLFLKFSKSAAHPLLQILTLILPFLLEAFLNPDSLGIRAFGGWNIFIYLTYLIGGFYVFSTIVVQQKLQKWGILLVIVTILSTTLFLQQYGGGIAPPFGQLDYVVFAFLRVCTSWLLILSLFYLGHRFLNRNSKALKGLSQAVMPFYVLHQPVIVLYGHFMRDITWSVPLKFSILFFCSITTIGLVYLLIVRKIPFLRFLCGVKWNRTNSNLVKDSHGVQWRA